MRITLNCAMSADGKIAFADRTRARLSGPEDKKRVHELRTRADAVLVGIGTVLADDPELLVDAALVPRPRQPLRVVLDSRLRTPSGARVLGGGGRTLVLCAQGHERPLEGAEVVACGSGRVSLPRAMELLEARGVEWVLVEGGGEVNAGFLRQGLADELLVYVAPRILGGGAPTPADGPAWTAADARGLELTGLARVGEGVLLHYRVVKP